jgi:NurA-like 5'-3' nuclease
MFGFNSTKHDVLEAKFEMYEELSKSMLEKLDAAVSAIQENSNKICLVLEKHDNRLMMTEKFDQDQIERMKDIKSEMAAVKASNTLEHQKVMEKMDALETRVDGLAKWKWQATAIIGFVIFLTSAVPNLTRFFQSFNTSTSIAPTEVVRKA